MKIEESIILALAEETKTALARQAATHAADLRELEASFDAKLKRLEDALAAVPRGPAGRDGLDGVPGERGEPGDRGEPGLQGPPGEPGARGKSGKDGRDGRDGKDGIASRDELRSEVLAAAATIRTDLSAELGAAVKEEVASHPLPRYCGVFKEGSEYHAGSFVTWAGSLWHCEERTTSRPGEGHKAWTLAVKRGRDGRDAVR